MNTRTQSACAAHIRTAVVRACIATCSKRCTIYNMALSYSCHSILLAYTNRVQCSGHNCAHAGVPLGARRVLCCIGGCATLKYLLAFPLACMELYLRCLCVGVLPPPYTLQGMDTWLRGIPRACVAMRPSVLCYLCDRVHVSVLRIVDVMGLHLSRSVVQIKLSPSRSGYTRHGTCSTTESLRDALGLGYMGTRSCNTALCSLLKLHNLRAQVHLRRAAVGATEMRYSVAENWCMSKRLCYLFA